MNGIRKWDDITLNQIMDAYSDTMKTYLYHCPPFLHAEIGYVPSVFDVAGILYSDRPFEENAFIVIDYCRKYKVFLKLDSDYMNIPFGEVW